MWQRLRNRKLDGLKFNRQHPLIYSSTIDQHYFFIADFYCHQQNLVVEVDGSVHGHQRDYDTERDSVINGLGLKVLRFTNDQVERDMNTVLNMIRESIK